MYVCMYDYIYYAVCGMTGLYQLLSRDNHVLHFPPVYRQHVKYSRRLPAIYLNKHKHNIYYFEKIKQIYLKINKLTTVNNSQILAEIGEDTYKGFPRISIISLSTHLHTCTCVYTQSPNKHMLLGRQLEYEVTNDKKD